MSTFSRGAVLVLSLIWSALPCPARVPDPPLRLPLEPLGYQPPSSNLLVSGSTMLTVHFVDNRHLLLTFSVRRLMKRLPDCPPDDYDRIIQALLLDLPAGNIVARTEWRVHDQVRYLWSIGNGRFILRNRGQLSVLSPLAEAPGETFKEHPFLHLDDRQIDVIHISPENDLLTVESSPNQPAVPPAAAQPFKAGPPPDAPPPPPRPPEQIQFFRIRSNGGVEPTLSSIATAMGPVDIPTTGAGYLKVSQESRVRWLFDFVSYAGKVLELSPFDSSCRPHPILVSNSEFVAIGCRGSNGSHNIGGFNSRGEEMWQQNFFEPFAHLAVVAAPAAGRFALSRTLLSAGLTDQDALQPEQINGQEVRVYQTDSGNVLLRVLCTPVQRAGQNFDLAPDGLSLIAIHDGAMEIYRLPPLTSKEQEAVKRAISSAPEPNTAAVRLAQGPPAGTATPKPADSPIPQLPVSAPALSTAPADQATLPSTPPPNPAAPSQPPPPTEAPPDTPRKAPTLYAPGEQPTHGSPAPPN